MKRSKQSAPPFVIPARYWRLKPLQWLVVDFMDWLFPFCAVNLLWVLLSLTLVLLPPATAALFETGYRAYGGESPSMSAFLRRTRRWLAPAWMWATPNLLLIVAAVVLARTVPGGGALAILFAAGVALLLLAQLYVWPFVMLQDSPNLLRAVRNSAFAVLGDPLLTGFNLGVTALVLVPSLLLIAPVLFVLPVFLCLLYSYTLIGWLGHHDILPGTLRDT